LRIFWQMELNSNIVALIEGIEVGKSDNEWFIIIKRNNAYISLNDIENFISALPLLNSSDLSMLKKLNFPLSDLLTLALTSNSEYWIDKALNQIIPLQLHRFKEELNNIENDRNFSQKIRHLAKKLKYQKNE